MKFIFKHSKKTTGLTLIELIISMAILGIVMVSFLTVFTSGFVAIMRSGHRADAAYDSQRIMTENIINHDGIETSNHNIEYNFEGLRINVDVDILKSTMSVDSNESEMKSFQPSP
ncbi:MAG: type II secretion system protein [Tindallia sp. MSAO_Bac2]|nr:MAG: type II secretion system protein [Tindallia sp. MSAO_Bac2]